MKALSPDNRPIVGTLERLYGVRPIQPASYRRNGDTLAFDYVNGVEVDWSSTETVTVGTTGQVKDDQRRAWAESQLILEP